MAAGLAAFRGPDVTWDEFQGSCFGSRPKEMHHDRLQKFRATVVAYPVLHPSG